MKIEINFEKLKNAVNQALNAVMKIGQNANLKGIYFEAADNRLTLRSTNIDVGFECSVSCKTEIDGKFLILGDVLARLLSSTNSKNSEMCLLSFESNTLNIKVDKHNFTLKTLNLDVFPSLPVVDGVDVDLEKNIFINGLRSVMYAVAKSEIKPEISGVFIKLSGADICFVATDAYRLAEKKIQNEKELPELGFILPEKNIKEILRILELAESDKKNINEEIKLTISKNSLQIKNENIFIVSRLIEGNFPNYNQIIPANPESFAIFLKEELVKSLRLVGLFSDKTSQVFLNVGSEDTQMEASNNEIGNTKETVNSTLKGEPFSVKINAKYLEEFLQNTSDQSVVIKYTAQNKAILVQGISDSNYTYLLMPSYR